MPPAEGQPGPVTGRWRAWLQLKLGVMVAPSIVWEILRAADRVLIIGERHLQEVLSGGHCL
jgi:hypothetical protein